MLTPNAAAKRAGVSRPTIMTALKNKALFGTRDNRNRWQIAPEDLDAWLTGRDSKLPVSDTVSEQAEADREISELRGEVRVLEERLSGRDALIEQLRADLDHARRPFWRKILDR